MPRPRSVLLAAASGLALVGYVWATAVKKVGAVKQRKRARRANKRATPRS